MRQKVKNKIDKDSIYYAGNNTIPHGKREEPAWVYGENDYSAGAKAWAEQCEKLRAELKLLLATHETSTTQTTNATKALLNYEAWLDEKN